MRDILEDMFGNEPLDPIESARRNMRPKLRKRFYQRAASGEGAPYPILLDDRAGQDAGGQRAGAAVARARRRRSPPNGTRSGERIDPADHAAHAARQHDHRRRRAERPSRSRRKSRKYLGSDLVCYRADTPEGLVAAQAQHWDPILAWARETLGARFVLGEGVMFVAQPEHAIAAARAAIPSDPWRLGAVNRDHHAHRLGADRARGRGAASSASTTPGPRRTSTRTGT